jgi:Tol biopolymer transport system component
MRRTPTSPDRWSPDGRQIVVERRRQDAYDLVLIDPETRAVRTLVTRSDARLVTPSWTPDGSTVLFSADLSATTSANVAAPFNVFSVGVPGSSAGALTNADALANAGEIRQLTDTVGGAQFPELSSNGTLTYVGYTTDGYDLFSVPLDPSFRDRSSRLQPDDQSFRPKAEATNVTPAGISPDAGGFRLQPEDSAIDDHPHARGAR